MTIEMTKAQLEEFRRTGRTDPKKPAKKAKKPAPKKQKK